MNSDFLLLFFFSAYDFFTPSFVVNPGELLMIIGPVGSGKSTLLCSLLGETALMSGSFQIRSGLKIGYVGQKPWIQACSFKQNVVGITSGKLLV